MALVPMHLKFSGWHNRVHVMKSDLHSEIRDADFASCACTWQSVFAYLKQHRNVDGQLSRTNYSWPVHHGLTAHRQSIHLNEKTGSTAESKVHDLAQRWTKGAGVLKWKKVSRVLSSESECR